MEWHPPTVHGKWGWYSIHSGQVIRQPGVKPGTQKDIEHEHSNDQ